jgi:adenylate cyclase
MSETRKIAAILVSDVVGYSRLAGADEDRTLSRLRGLRSDLIDPAIAAHHGRVVKRTGDGSLVEFRSVVDAVRCAIEVQNAMVERNAGVPEDRRILFRIGIHLGDVVEESDGDLMGDGVNIAARLEGIAEPGAICLSEDAYRQVKGRLDLAVTDLGPTRLKNIAEPVRVYSIEDGLAPQPKPAPPTEPATTAKPAAPNKRPTSALLFIGIAALLVLIAAGAWYFLAASRPVAVATNAPAAVATNAPAAVAASVATSTEAPRLSIVVLPFANLSNDPEQDYFADGITDDLTTDLSHLADSFVIARNTAFTYKGKAVDVKQIGRELGVRYVLEGSVRRLGENITVNAQLISTETGAHVWADRFDGERSRLGELQVEFVARLANSLNLQLIKAESLRSLRERPNNPDAVDLAMRGWALWDVPDTAAVHAEIIDDFERALRIDPQQPEALIGLSEELAAWDEKLDRAVALASRALLAHPDNAEAHNAKALSLREKGQIDAAIAEAEAAIAVDRNDALAYAIAGFSKLYIGRAAEGFSGLETALRLSPRDPWRPFWEWQICSLHAHLAQWDQAIEWCRKSIATQNNDGAYIDMAAAYAWIGRDADARAAVAELLKLKPHYTLQQLANSTKKFDNPTYQHELLGIEEGLRKAGLPEQ